MTVTQAQMMEMQRRLDQVERELQQVPLWPGGGGSSESAIYVIRGGNELFPSGLLGVIYATSAVASLPSSYTLPSLPTTPNGIGIAQHIVDETWHLVANYDGAGLLQTDLIEGQRIYAPTTVSLSIDTGGTATLVVPATIL